MAQEAIIGGGPGSTIWEYPLFDPIIDSFREGVKEAVTRRNDFNAFGLCLPICLLAGKTEALRDMWRMLGGAKLTEDSKETTRCGPAAYMNRLRNDGQVLADCCRNTNEIVLALVKAEKEVRSSSRRSVRPPLFASSRSSALLPYSNSSLRSLARSAVLGDSNQRHVQED